MTLQTLLLAISGHRRTELESHPFSVTHQRLCLGALVIGSALTGAILFGLAVSRIDPSHSLRYAFGLLAGELYFCMLLAFDALFVVGSRRPNRWAIAARIALSLMVTAFSSITLDALIAGKRLDAEIDTRRLDADLLIRAKHGEVNNLKGKTNQVSVASKQADNLEQRLAADPDTPKFSAAISRAKSAEQRHRNVAAELEPQLTEIRAQLAELQGRLQTSDSSDERASLKPQIAELRARRDAVNLRLRDAERSARDAKWLAESEAGAEFKSRIGRALREQAQEQELRQQLAKSELDALAKLHERSTDLIVDAWVKAQSYQKSVEDSGSRATLEYQFDALQSAMTGKLQQLLEQIGRQGASAMAAKTGPEDGDLGEPEPVAL